MKVFRRIYSVSVVLCVYLVTLGVPIVLGQEVQKDDDFHIYLLLGQSNMAGRGKITPEFAAMEHERVFALDAEGHWVKAKHPLHFDKPKRAGVGPGLSFGMEIAEADSAIRVGLVPCAVGGTDIGKWTPGSFDEITKTYPFDDAVRRLKTAQKYGVIKGVLWMQGEANSTEKKKHKYLKKLSKLISRIRKESNTPDLPFVVSELGRYKDSYALINEQLAKLPLKVKNTWVVSSEGLTHKGDGVHLNSESAHELGIRFARAVLSIR
ncbi:sialate O-acetylesterase [Parapedobacter tibetensis]|uniref:sialate O-acetylesterase n=1 Tax=Parapedobacter tibetensis TaxID=2972951 RepID=UPI00214DE08D|nr:sialate O-acetylesterase [Parapedobacter tibetensis]